MSALSTQTATLTDHRAGESSPGRDAVGLPRPRFPRPLVLVEAVGVGYLPDGRRYRHGGWRGASFADRLQVAAGGLV